MREEGPGILAWAVRGALDWHRNGLRVPKAVELTTERYQQAEDVIGEFIDECCTVGEDQYAGTQELVAAWQTWNALRGTSSRDALGRRELISRLEQRLGLVSTRPSVNGRQVRRWKGIGINGGPHAS